mmetsp:Transcript_5036/g.12377  ORF Transcript_5036/g.12377 Transcript_5036/m.12377 type:complete len:283 (-) Transcript_5036:2689-3537(-)
MHSEAARLRLRQPNYLGYVVSRQGIKRSIQLRPWESFVQRGAHHVDGTDQHRVWLALTNLLQDLRLALQCPSLHIHPIRPKPCSQHHQPLVLRRRTFPTLAFRPRGKQESQLRSRPSDGRNLCSHCIVRHAVQQVHPQLRQVVVLDQRLHILPYVRPSRQAQERTVPVEDRQVSRAQNLPSKSDEVLRYGSKPRIPLGDRKLVCGAELVVQPAPLPDLLGGHPLSIRRPGSGCPVSIQDGNNVIDRLVHMDHGPMTLEHGAAPGRLHYATTAGQDVPGAMRA